MPIADVMRQGWRRMPDRVSVTFKNQTAPGTYSSSTLRNCWRRPLGLTEAENSQGVYLKDPQSWFIPKVSLRSRPTPGDIISFTASTRESSPHYGMSGDYVVMPEGVQEVGALGAWRCSAVRFFLQSGLTDTVSIYRPAKTIGDGGRLANSGSPTTLASAVPAKIQEVDSFGVVPLTGTSEFGKLQIPKATRCYITTTVRVQPHDYLIDQSSNKWTVRNSVFEDMLGMYQALDLERMPPGISS